MSSPKVGDELWVIFYAAGSNTWDPRCYGRVTRITPERVWYDGPRGRGSMRRSFPMFFDEEEARAWAERNPPSVPTIVGDG